MAQRMSYFIFSERISDQHLNTSSAAHETPQGQRHSEGDLEGTPPALEPGIKQIAGKGSRANSRNAPRSPLTFCILFLSGPSTPLS